MTPAQQPREDERKYRVNGRPFTNYEDANLYWQVHGGTLMEKLDAMTPWHALQSKPHAH